MNNATKLIEKIREENLKPRARWRFTFRNAIAWLGFLFAVVFGALAFSVILFAIQQVDFNIIEHMSHSAFELLLALVPLFWIISMIVFLSIAILSFKKSKKGYKISSGKLVSSCVALGMLGGTLFFISGGAIWLENAFATNVGVYESIQDKKTEIWMMPEEGYLAGSVMSVNENELKLMDFNNQAWSVDFQGADIVPMVKMETGEKIKLIGLKISDTRFKAEKIRPWGGIGRMNRNKGGK